VVFLGRKVPDDVSKDRKIFTEWILSAPQETILAVTPVSVPEPEPAKIRDSVPCTMCDETVMESRLKNLGGKPVCIPCFENHQSIKGPGKK
jgi:formylmethanofuran dehydrogenase subunit E